MLKRVISAVVLLAIVAVCFVLSTETAVLLIAVCGVLCCFELGNALKKLERNPVAPLAFAFVIGSALIIYFKLSLVLLVALLGAIFLADFTICMASKNIPRRTRSQHSVCLYIRACPWLRLFIYARCRRLCGWLFSSRDF